MSADQLRVFLFGEPRARFGSEPFLTFPTEKTLELLAFVSLHRESPALREQVAAALRSDTTDTKSRKALSTDLWRLRRIIDDGGRRSEDYLLVDRRSIGLVPDAPVSLDVIEFERVVDRVAALEGDVPEDDVADLAAAVELYDDEFAATLDSQWCELLRERLRGKHHAALSRLIDLEMEADQWDRALQHADRLIEADPLLEHAHRAVMTCQYLMGNRAAAIRQYTRCAELLDRELGVAPSEETQRMHRGLLLVQPASDAPGSTASSADRTPALVSRGRDRPLTDQLAMALNNLANAQSLVANVDSQLRAGAPTI